MLIHFKDTCGAITWTQHQNITLEIPNPKRLAPYVVNVKNVYQRIVSEEEALRLLAILNQIDRCCEEDIPEM